MQLTKLEIRGFKSFGDKAVINFDNGITGIVGPNGCGKSNVVDAIRWVLGEQKTRALRSEKMENIIFNGTRTRKPTNLAEVSLTFKNTKNLLPTEYTEVTITRRYYRSGDSEYLLNGINCRLKDIQSLFMDTGINSNSYAIIELKMIEELLTDKDNSRRALFEEAAGISKFKTRKKETLKKLSATDADLERVEDLLFEVEKNMKSLEKQAKQAERYFKTKEEYKQLSLEYAKVQASKHRDTLITINEKLQAENDRKLSFSKQIAEMEAEVEKLKSDMLQKEKLLASRQRTLNEYVGKIRQFESEKKLKNERTRFLEEKSNSLRQQISQDKQSLEQSAGTIQSLHEQKQSAERQLQEAELKVQELKEAYETQKVKTNSLQEEVNELNRQFNSKQQAVHEVNKRVEIKQMQLSSLKQEMEKASSDSTAQSTQLEDLELQTGELSQMLSEEKHELSELQEQEKALDLQIEQTQENIEWLREEVSLLNRQLDAKEHEYKLTKSMVENLEGFPDAIKFLRKNEAWDFEAPLLSEIISCEERYRLALENYLEPYMNYYVVENQQQAFQAVNLLKEAAKGKAHFFILDSLKDFQASDKKNLDKAKAAIEVADFDEKYRKLAEFVLDQVYIYEGEPSSLPQQPDAVFISENAELIHRPFASSGGSVGLFEGKRIGRAKNLEKLDQEIQTLTAQQKEKQERLQENQQKVASLKASSKKDKIESSQREINKLNQEYVTVRTKLEQLTQMVRNMASKREDIQEQVEVLTEELYELKPQAEDDIAELKRLEERLGEMNDELLIHNEQLSERSAVFNEENIQFHQQKNRVDSILQEISFKENNMESARQRLEKNEDDLRNNEAEITAMMSRAEEGDDVLIGMYDEKENIEKAVNEAETEYYKIRSEIDQKEKDSREVNRNKENLDGLLLEYQGRLNELKLNISSVKERLLASFNIDLDEIMNDEEQSEVQTELSEDELKEKTSKLRDRIDRMGPVNPMAMEAYEEVKERFDFITTQKADLVQAKESLMSTIGEIDLVARETFMDAFEKVKTNFVKVFRSLFTEEDDCNLSLVDPDNPLESKIEIIAKPKGKRPLSINQLSGGEKTLTATSLLFSLYLLKPAPFCIFDEVDAPLDDANIDKFNNIIRKFSDDSQFIIVTHNKRTMSTTDIIYGITMIEMGVSRVVPVSLKELADS